MALGLNTFPVRRLLWIAGLAAVMLVVHLGLVDLLARRLDGFGSADAMPPRMEVRYISEMTLSAPPQHAAAAPASERPHSARVAAAPDASASVPESVQPLDLPVASEVQQTATPPPEQAAVLPPDDGETAAVAAAAVSASEPASGAPFEWPVSTRMRYVLTGHYRGEVHGDAQVEWLRAGSRYQVHLDVSVGLLASRRMSSDGVITSAGLSPRRYDQETRLAFDKPNRATLRFEPDRVLLSNGQAVPRVAGVQDTVSQFVQLSWLFATQPQRLQVGAVVELPLAMPRSVSTWTYDVVAKETLLTPFGEVQTYHLKPRREPRAGGDMVVDIWIAPQLRHLPVRFRIRPDPEAHFDLVLDRRPELAAPEPERNPEPNPNPDTDSRRLR